MPWETIPQVFYDLIARIVPGAAVLFLAYCLFILPIAPDALPAQWMARIESPPIWLAFVLSYLLGRLLAEIWDFGKRCLETRPGKIVGGFVGRQVRKSHVFDACKISDAESWSKRLEEYGILAETLRASSLPPSSEAKAPNLHLLHDHLRVYAPSDAFRMLKVRAEQRMLESLCVGLILVLLVDLVYSRGNHWPAELALFLVVLLCWWGERRSGRLYLTGIHRAWLIHNNPLGAAEKTAVWNSGSHP